MRMSAFEKFFVNREGKGASNFDRVHAVLERLESHPKRVLEIGCGIGTVSACMARVYGWDVVGTDVDPGQIALAQQKNGSVPGCHFQVEDASALRLDDAAFDLVLTQHTFHHVREWRKAIAEIGRVLAPGGTLVWMDFALAPAVRKLLTVLSRRYGVYTLDDITRASATAGMELDEATRMEAGIFPVYLACYRKAAGDMSRGTEAA